MAKATTKNEDPISTGGPSGSYYDGDPGHEVSTVGRDMVPAQAGEISTPVKLTNDPKMKHKATYATDKRSGGYCVRVVGPHANKFAGKIVPVTRRDDSMSEETLVRLVWSGIDNGTAERPGTGKPIALYTFAPKPKNEEEILF